MSLEKKVLPVWVLIGKAILFGVIVFLCWQTVPWLLNKYLHRQKVFLSFNESKMIKLGSVSFYLPDNLIPIKSKFEPLGQVIFASEDRKVNESYYQVEGIDLQINLDSSGIRRVENVPLNTAQLINPIVKNANTELFVYMGADGSGQGRGASGSVHQADIKYNKSWNNPDGIGIYLYCYDHSSKDQISKRCEDITNMILSSIRIGINLFGVII